MSSGRRLGLLAGLWWGFACGAASASPQVDYILHCQGCHLADGGGTPGAVPALRDSVGKYLLVPRGREYLIRVPGSSMSPLADAELAAVLNWMIERFGPSEISKNFRAFSASEVSGLRRPALTEVEELRSELIGQMK